MKRVLVLCLLVFFLTQRTSRAHVAPLGESCRAGDAGKICLAIKYVVYRTPAGMPVASEAQAISNIENVNKVWAKCNLGFQIEEYIALKPPDYGLAYNTSTYRELDDIRDTLNDERTLLITTTGPWNRAGTLGGTSANAWTSMPGGAPFGVIVESTVGTFANIVAHELGHYLNLSHLTEASDLMSPIIYSNSTALNATQCRIARTAARSSWARMLR